MPSSSSNAVQRRFDFLREKTQSDLDKTSQSQNEGLQRQVASKGGLGSGAYFKIQQQQNEAQNAQKQSALMDVEGQREMAQAGIDEAEANRQFSREERIGSQEFASGEAGKQRLFQSEEAKAQRAFDSAEAKVQRGFSKKLFDKDLEFKNKVQKDSNKQFGKNMELALKQFKLDKKVSNFNMDMANKMWNKKDMMETFANTHGYNPRDGSWGNDASGNSIGWGGGNAFQNQGSGGGPLGGVGL